MSAVDKKIVRAWVKRQSGPGKRAARPSIALGCLNAVIGIGQAWCVAQALSDALTQQYQAIPANIIGFGALAVLRALCQFSQETSATKAGIAARRRLRREVLESVVTEGPGLLRRHHSGELSALIVDRIEALDGYFARWMPASTLWITAPFIIFLGVLWINPRAALILGLCGLAVPIAQAVFGIGAALASRNQFLAMTRLQARFLDRIRGIATIVLAGAEKQEARSLALAADELRQRTMKVLRVAFLSSAAIDIAMVIVIIGLVLTQGHLLRELAMGGAHAQAAPAIARALFALLVVPEFFAPLRSLALAYQDRAHAAGAAEAMHDLVPATPADVPTTNAAHQPITLTARNVYYRWNDERPFVLQNINFSLKPGEVLVLEGASGAGKSTLIELLLGFIQPTEGNILFDGIDISTLSPRAVASRLAWIGQRPVLFAGTLRENIAFARPDATESQINEAIRAASVDRFLDDLPDGLETRIGEGGFGLSGGQAQRIAIARAYLKDAPLLLLDEPTAHLDPETEQEILASLSELTRGRTVVLCSHSQAVRDFGTKYLILDRGRMLEAAA
ncbi:thiol reductant ABC exporter subunit CydD [Kozakia baliensis]|uniref:Thiol reductant ABC exporter subunit CydD n=1 Tax=Kozakia baliensis TaxID=153496 RepID=A0A1D8UU22_9PROT|nr:thiol reductant ABC exporter subunit CydD [Kozakia baliensis]AOX16977.1 thiol reductant ABC exporter subunit CydD [Kozakia baliensis]GEL63970.1 thiol reductant ABC exporter subunit CydD [Kozakia baliensis]